MKLPFLFSMLLFSVMIVANLAQSTPAIDQDRVKLDAITQRVRNGDTAAILEEAEIRPDISVPVLSIAAQDKSTDPERAELARKALSQIKGVEDYLKRKIDAQSGKRTLDAVNEQANQLEILSLVRTNKAIRIIASYLFDDKDSGYSGSDYTIVPPKIGATVILDDMRLPGAPTTDFTDYDKHVAAWRAWWLKNQDRFDDASPYRGK